MKINKLKINGYGKIKNKEIELKDNINIIYGKNESGKSTILKFVINSFYGASKNKKGKDISDYEKYLPWETEEFSGKINYELDSKEKFEIYREFKKKNPKIFNELSEEISKEFNIDKNKGSEFFYEQTKIDEETFLSTAVIQQQEVKLDKNIQNILIQKISNLVSTGKDNISYKKSIEKINKKQLEEIGTDRTREKPINIIKSELAKINIKLNECTQHGEELKYIEEKIKIIKENNIENKNKIEILKDINVLKQEVNLEEEKIKINEKIKNDQEEKIKLLNIKQEEKIREKKENEKNNIKEKLEENKKNKNKKLIIFFILLLIINIVQYIIIKNILIKNICLLTIPIYLIYYILIKNKLNKKIKNEEKNNIEKNRKIENEILEIENEIKIIERNKKEIEKQITKIEDEKIQKNENKIIEIKNKYKNKISETKITEQLFTENIEDEINILQQESNRNEIEIANLKMQKSTIEDEILEKEKLEENKIMLMKKHNELSKYNQSIELAKEVINEAYEEMKKSISPKLLSNISESVSNITNGKHNTIKLNDESGLVVELENGNYVNADRLSIGTIDQLYLSLRFAMLEEISSENMPIILDESFAYYDDERLKNILKYLIKKYTDRQILIFTCTQREEEILKNINAEYNIVVL